ncbi:Hypothetical predicted protein [Cloeon dipterum]|uniref:FZ domain-containing protein n=1 Tax=Cloeon dipterum TaxID=197152 RepID=A0A8S1D6Y1_9INSE|nr:Hypothetical predicted protein [Cloeon dipterum]
MTRKIQVVLLMVGLAAGQVTFDWCETLTVPFCQDVPNMPYNLTYKTNSLSQKKQQDAGLDAFLPVKNCSSNFQALLCNVFAPACTVLPHPIPPCRSACVAAKSACEAPMSRSGIAWPHELDCGKFPDDGKPCIDVEDSSAEQ